MISIKIKISIFQQPLLKVSTEKWNGDILKVSASYLWKLHCLLDILLYCIKFFYIKFYDSRVFTSYMPVSENFGSIAELQERKIFYN